MRSLLPDRGPARRLAVVTLVNMTGYGIYLTVSVLYFTRAVHLPASQVGIGLSTAGGASLIAGIPAGHLADRRGARGVYATTLALAALAMAGLCFTNGFWSFLLFVCLGTVAQTAGAAARSPLVHEYGGEHPARFRSYLRALTNLGVAVGALLAGWGVQVDTRGAYLLLIAGAAAASGGCSLIVLSLPVSAPRPSSDGPRWIVLRDAPYLALTVLDGVLAIQYRVLTAAVPLWLVSRTHAPRWSVSTVILVNTVIVVLFQVRASRNVDTPRAGALALRRAGVAFLAACVLLSLLEGVPSWAALALLLTATVVHTVGELWHAAGGFELSFSLAHSHAVGQYQGLFGMGLGLGQAIGPALLIILCIGWGAAGWWVVGAMFALTGLVVPAATRWAERTRVSAPTPDAAISGA
ncbi:MFS transporter [Frankia sp. CiP3]|uniref:MFS transporter n=1 Tax=Frankia sp. CiP3 TaxID=2880971 RepID=UPI001EF730B3|nr:MFS transporter [Frankia sp. CiP3]